MQALALAWLRDAASSPDQQPATSQCSMQHAYTAHASIHMGPDSRGTSHQHLASDGNDPVQLNLLCLGLYSASCLQTAFRRPEENNHVHTEVPFSDGSIMRIANTPEQLAKHLQVGGAWAEECVSSREFGGGQLGCAVQLVAR
jgi:hypothetical protein